MKYFLAGLVVTAPAIWDARRSVHDVGLKLAFEQAKENWSERVAWFVQLASQPHTQKLSAIWAILFTVNWYYESKPVPKERRRHRREESRRRWQEFERRYQGHTRPVNEQQQLNRGQPPPNTDTNSEDFPELFLGAVTFASVGTVLAWLAEEYGKDVVFGFTRLILEL
ncbi:hypothetical protein RhiJN_27448 [Ceratobasidium sp. AG-Ba]|nr:hypothetical protein RhiJN_13383 [Ceratobasidium sp. AG-Ba]QRV99429.1 hypothetical protein RhiJN_27448 [Ceratobasidium sp. AG-Ba]QRW13936.1 hypothetical protein RhiLY_12935 [Ceratobasidium sp. AG-Ba]